MIKGIIFDLDGTLLESMHVWDTVASTYLRTLGYDPDPDTDDIMKEASIQDAASYFRKRYGIQKTVNEIAFEVNAELEDAYFRKIQPKAGVMAMLEAFKARGIRMVAATATERYLILPCIERLGILDYFSQVFTCAEVGTGKSEPLIYHLATEALGLDKSEVAIFEDALYAAHTAKNDGYYLVGIYDDSMKYRQDELKSIADLYVPSYEALDVDACLFS